MRQPVRVALVGYGTGGRYFHAPFIEAADDIEIATVVTRSDTRARQVRVDLPGTPVSTSLHDALRHNVDVAVITTPPGTRRALVLEALAAGLATVADKPFAPDAATALELARAAEEAGRPLAVYFNRRWDADVRTLKAVLDSGRIGEVERFTARMDENAAGLLDDTADGGLLRDLGSHLVDQALWLFGPVRTVYAELDWSSIGDRLVDTGFALSLTHQSGTRSHLTASKTNRAAQKELRVLGTRGSYRSDSSDVQATASQAGRRPARNPRSWGIEPETHWGVLSTADGREKVPSAKGAYQDFYTAFAAAVRHEGAVPVPAGAGIAVARVLDAARLSDARTSTVSLDDAVSGSGRGRGSL